MRNFHIFLFALAAIVLMPSCVGQKRLSYLRTVDASSADSINKTYVEQREQIFRSGDQLVIIVTALDPEAAAPFNLMLTPRTLPQSSEMTISSGSQYQPYFVDPNGNIQMPIIGEVHVDGLTRTELRDLLLSRLTPLLACPNVTINLNGAYVTLLGEVSHPGKYALSTQRTTIFDALAFAGDLTIYGKRQNVLISREKDGKMEFARINLNDPAIYGSPFYYINQNDVIYVEPNNARALSSQNVGLYLSMVTTLASLVTVTVSVVSSAQVMKERAKNPE